MGRWGEYKETGTRIGDGGADKCYKSGDILYKIEKDTFIGFFFLLINGFL